VHLGEAIVAAGVPVVQALVIEAHHVQDGRVQVVNVHLVLHGVPVEFGGGAVDVARSRAAAGHPQGETEKVVFAAVLPFGGWSAPGFASPEDQGIVE
jgi:hypothetical protein